MVDCALELVVVPAPPAPVVDVTVDVAAVDPLLAALLVTPEVEVEVEVALESPDPPHAKNEAQATSNELDPNDASIRLRKVGRDYHRFRLDLRLRRSRLRRATSTRANDEGDRDEHDRSETEHHVAELGDVRSETVGGAVLE